MEQELGGTMESTPIRRRPTVHDVARAAGVSHATVSRHVNGHTNVAPATATAIDDAVKAIGYVPNRTARSLVRRETNTVAFVVREHVDLFYADPTLSRMAAGANAFFAERGFLMPLLLVDSPPTAQRVIHMIQGGAVDGALLGAMTTDDPVVTALRGSFVPIVTASTPVIDDNVAWVDTDNQTGTRTITQLLRATGRHRVAEIRGPTSMPVSVLRHRGFVEALGDDYDPSLVVDATEWSFEAGAAGMATLLDLGRDIDGVVAASDLLAAGAVSVLAARGLVVPDDVAVVGFDDSPIATITRPALTTVRQDSHATGWEMASLLMRIINREPIEQPHVLVPSSVVWRESAGAHPAPSCG